MKYEFFFLKLRKRSKAQVLRTIAPSALQARHIIARRYGFDMNSNKTPKQYLDSKRIYEVDVENVLLSEFTREAVRK